MAKSLPSIVLGKQKSSLLQIEALLFGQAGMLFEHFSDKYPDKWLPLYSRVTFSLQPYAEALAIGDSQNEIMQEVLKMDNIETNWNSIIVENKILSLLG